MAETQEVERARPVAPAVLATGRLAGRTAEGVVRIADQVGTAPESRLYLLPEPYVQHVVQEHVGEQGR